MALDKVTQEILKDADDKAAAIRAEATVEIDKIKADAESRIAEMKEKEDKRLKDEIALLERQEVSSSELESKKIVLAKKKEVLTKAFEATLADLENAPKDVKLGHYKAMVASAKKVIDKPKAFIAVSDNFTADELGVSEVVKDSKVRSGLILQSEDGQIEVDMQYSTLLQEIWDREIKTVSDMLFG